MGSQRVGHDWATFTFTSLHHTAGQHASQERSRDGTVTRFLEGASGLGSPLFSESKPRPPRGQYLSLSGTALGPGDLSASPHRALCGWTVNPGMLGQVSPALGTLEWAQGRVEGLALAPSSPTCLASCRAWGWAGSNVDRPWRRRGPWAMRPLSPTGQDKPTGPLLPPRPSHLKEISPEYSLEGLMQKLKLQ